MRTCERREEVVDDRRQHQNDVVRRDGYSIRRVEPHHARTSVWAKERGFWAARAVCRECTAVVEGGASGALRLRNRMEPGPYAREGTPSTVLSALRPTFDVVVHKFPAFRAIDRLALVLRDHHVERPADSTELT